MLFNRTLFWGMPSIIKMTHSLVLDSIKDIQLLSPSLVIHLDHSYFVLTKTSKLLSELLKHCLMLYHHVVD
jgi:hypothetical protein